MNRHLATPIHPIWCECRACAPNRSTLGQDIRESVIDTGLGAGLGAIVAAAILITHHWPAIAAAAVALHG
ncbi:hypothetical protein [Sphingosinicella sp. CPCC 101087]|uniref:hypothetical protein n=1 Tax=Sphingosinicella sp. CPCC 101087 TaxID=2497754 RepID=UPI00101CAF76|nr:hypothetical protein [Sphingosinicella sp. CPCC 101087]